MAERATTLRTLADRIEREPASWELDAEIALAVGWKRSQPSPHSIAWWMPPDVPSDWTMVLPAFTTSIDAALTLLPEYISFELRQSASGEKSHKRAHLWDWHRGPLMSDPTNEWNAQGNTTLAAMICAAALRALAEGLRDG